MAFVLELTTTSSQPYIKNYIISIIREFDIDTIVRQQKDKIICAFTSEHPELESCLEAIAQRLPASCFLKSSSHYEIEGEPDELPEYKPQYPLGLGLCPSCQKEMFDPSSRRYYYPFTSCTHCGGQYSSFNGFPYIRANTSFSFFRPCSRCEEETNSVGIREHHQINSCHDCGVPVKLLNKENERYANDAGSFRTMFEVAAKALKDNKRVLLKTTMGYRLFYTVKQMHNDSVLMLINAQKITNYISVIEEEFNALLSIERPVLHVAVKDEALKAALGNTIDVKYPDEGFSILLSKELQTLGEDFIGYEVADATTEADILMDFDLEVTAQEDLRLFINKDIQFIAEGERVCFPSTFAPATHTLSVAHGLVGVVENEAMLFDKMEHFDAVSVEKAVVLEGETENWHSKQHTMSHDEASFMSVIAEHQRFGTKCVGAYFYEEPSFLYYDGKKVIRLVPPKEFHPAELLEKMATLREGSERLVKNLEDKMPEVYAKLQALEKRENVTLFEATAIILGLKDESMRGVTKEALKFVGKGGLQIDTRVKDNRFDHTAFLSSIVSYQLADVDTVLLSYSIFESFGDYFNELLQEIKGKTKAEHVVLCGSHFANQSLFSRVLRNLKQTPPLLNINYPIGKENAVVGGVYL
ncbi:MAG: hypothetical protein PF439_06015 [Helicobacteraceae bacterium]|jgi:hydrogenase maturation protein HypF|nr:hypothetical protein [Helicobacteraceae bacterium]